MDESLVIILIVLLIAASLLYYHIYVKRTKVNYRTKAGLFNILFVITPILLLALYYQSGAENRLSEVGFVPHPNFQSSVGVVTGTEKEPIWVFSYRGNKSEIMNFYRDTENHGVWRLLSDRETALTFYNHGKKMNLMIDDKYVFFMLSDEAGSKQD
ncbi:MAG: hypothetical protein OEZ68_18325 [Gammaproteobacteria bacterium]|nr:hypothetical protein [Gammaproteobacteria bacterium]MDH5802763.1 hypothetical protein [Gammaproteobacteria bacterium]